MSRASVNFKALAEHLQPYHANLITSIVSGGSVKGYEYSASSINGGPGNSFKFNILTGKWSDFANPDHKGGDIISLYAVVNNVTQKQAADRLAELTSYNFKAPQDAAEKLPNMIHSQHGPAAGFWIYRSKRGQAVGLVVRYEPTGEKKQFAQWHYDLAQNKWIPRAIPDDRPLYKLDKIDSSRTLPIILCEGEKSADAAQELFGADHIATCWIGGTQAIKKTDFSPLYGRDVILWPDNDEPGIKAMSTISKLIISRVNSMQFINPQPDDHNKFDAYDLLQQAPDMLTFDEYLYKRTSAIKISPVLKNIKNPTPDSETHTLDPALGESIVNAPSLESGVGPIPAPSSHIVKGEATHYGEDQQELEILRDSNMIVRWQDYGITMKSETKPYLNEQNVLKILKKHQTLNTSVYYDEFHKSYMSTFGSTKPQSFSDVTFTKFKLYMQENFGLGDISTATIKESLRYYASQTIKNSVSDYLLSLKWDGQPRIDSFMHLIYGADNTEYNIAASRIFWLSMVARILYPATKADIMIILEGDQGIQKSASLEEIGTLQGQNYYAVSGKRMDNKDFFIGLAGKYIIEMGEINALLKNSDEDIKEMLSTRIDHYRIPYASESTPNERTNVFVGTTNQENYLRDETGARRFLPVKCKSVNMELLREFKLQFFAEAVYRKQQNEDHWVFPKELAKEETDKRMELDDIWTDDVFGFVSKFRYVRINDVAEFALHMTIERRDQRALNRISKILRKLGFKRNRYCVHGIQTWVYEDFTQNNTDKSWEYQTSG